ncbi:MAG: NUDIX domain-containing protein [Patescibacteria group bacterium]
MTISEIKDKELHRIATTTLVYKPDFTYLITKRAMHKKVMPGKWTIPGGGLSTDDYVNTPSSTEGAKQWYGSLITSLKRELKEEVNLEIGKPELLTDLTFVRPDGVPVLVLSYFAAYVSGEVSIDQDIDGDTTDFAWVTLEQAKNYDLIDGIWDEIREVEEILKSRGL